jgi:hypothetical protein
MWHSNRRRWALHAKVAQLETVVIAKQSRLATTRRGPLRGGALKSRRTGATEEDFKDLTFEQCPLRGVAARRPRDLLYCRIIF